MAALNSLLERIKSAPACLVTVESTQGSVPRESGAWMALFAGAEPPLGTIGGGHLELQAMQEGRARRVEHLAVALARVIEDTRDFDLAALGAAGEGDAARR